MKTFNPLDRRPIAARHWNISRRLANWLANRGVGPNLISTAGLTASIGAGTALAATAWVTSGHWVLWLSAAGLIGLRLAANMFDGMVAIESKKTSAVGFLFNEIPDRVSDSAILIGLGYANDGVPELGYIAALAAMFTAYVRAVGAQVGAGQCFVGPMAKQQRMAVVVVVALVSIFAPQPWLPTAALTLIALGSVITSIHRLVRTGGVIRRSTP